MLGVWRFVCLNHKRAVQSNLMHQICVRVFPNWIHDIKNYQNPALWSYITLIVTVTFFFPDIKFWLHLFIGEFETLKYGTEGKAYFFTRQQQKYLEGSRLIRSPISNGYWRRCGREIPIHNDSGILGFKTIFVWQEPGYKEDSNWKMTEYRINPTFMEDLSQTKVSCFLFREVSRLKKRL